MEFALSHTGKSHTAMEMNQWKAPGSVASSFTRQLQEVGMYRDTTLTAATRAKVVTKLRVSKEKERAKRSAEQIEKRRRRERMKLANSLKLKLRQLDRQQRRVNLMSKVTSARMIQQTWRRYTAWKANCILKLLYESAVVIQKIVRRRQCQKLLAKLRRERRSRAAQVMQACVRGYRARKLVAALVRDRFAAAVLIQGQTRRRRACKLRAALHRSVCVRCIQRIWRGYLARRRVELLVIKELELICQQAEEKRMSEEDICSRLVDQEVKRIDLEREECERAELELKLAQESIAQKHGIPLLPWRRRTTSFSKLVEQQRRERVRKEKAEELHTAQQAERERAEKQHKLEDLEKHRCAMLQKSKRKSREIRVHKRRIEVERKKLEDLERKKQKALQKLKRREEERTNAKRRARLLSLSKRKQERERQEAEERKKLEEEREERRLYQLKALEQRRMEEIRKAAEEAKKRHAIEERKKAEEEKLRQIANQEAEERKRVDENLRKMRLREQVERQKEKERQRAAKMEKTLLREQEKRREEGKKKAIELRRRILENLAKEERAKDRRFPRFAEVRNRPKRQRIKVSKRRPVPVKARRNPVVQTPTKSPRLSDNIDESIENIFRRAEDILLPRLSQTKAKTSVDSQGRDDSSCSTSSRIRRKARKKKQRVDDTLARALEWKLQELKLHGSPNQQEGQLTEASLIEIANPMLSARRTPEQMESFLLDQNPHSEEYSDDSDFERAA